MRTLSGITDWFHCQVGTRQGCMLSPLLFALYLNEFIDMINGSNCQGVFVNEAMPNVCTLLYADDMVLCADTVGRLQAQLDVLENYCNLWGMKVNLKKSKIIVYRNGGIVKSNERWFYMGESLENVSYYKYLGILFSSRLSWSVASDTLRKQALKSCFNVYKLERECNGLPISVQFELFDKIVIPVLCYGSEVWGYEYNDKIESVHIS